MPPIEKQPWETNNVPRRYWKERENRIFAIRWLVEKLGKPVTHITRKDFENSGLYGLLTHYYSTSPFLALKDAGFDIKETDRHIVPMGYWKKRENRVRAIREFVDTIGKPSTEITQKDFYNYNLGGLLTRYYFGSPFLALNDAGYNTRGSYKPITNRVQKGYWKERENRVKAIRRLVDNLGKPIPKIIKKDFSNNRLGGLLTHYYSDSPFLALKDAGFDIKETDMHIVPMGYWKKRENRVRAIRELVNNLDKPITEIVKEDFLNSGLGGLLHYYSESPFLALKDAGFDIKETELTKAPNAYWKKRENRVRAIRELVNNLDKPITEIVKEDFLNSGLRGLIRYYSESPFLALKDAGYDVTYEEMKHGIFHSGKMKYVSNHGHKFKSMEERDIDNILWDWGLIHHRHNVPYPNSKLNCDFVFNNGKYWVEYAGLLGIPREWTHRDYRKIIDEKVEIARKNNLDLIIIKREDFEKNKLKEKLKDVLNECKGKLITLDYFSNLQ